VNCQQINHLLDAHAAEELTRAQRETVDRHLASCPACSEDWAHLREITALPVPAMSGALRGRIAAALAAQHAVSARRAFRPFLVGGLLLGGAVLAAAFALQFAHHDPQPLPAVADSSPVAGHVLPEEPGSAQILPPMAAIDSAVVGKADKPARATENGPLDQHGIVVLKRPDAVADASALATLTRCHDAMVRQLRAVTGLDVIADAAVSAYEAGRSTRLDPTPAVRYEARRSTRLDPAPDARYRLQNSDGEIARKLGAANVLIVRNENGCAANLYNSRTGFPITGLMYGGGDPQQADWDSLASSLARLVHDKTLLDVSGVHAAARATVLNASLSDRDRALALGNAPDPLFPGDRDALRGFFDKELLAAATQLGTKSADAEVREGVWARLRHVNDAALLQPLLRALASDPDASVRVQAALDLYVFLDQPGVREALQRAVAEDPSQEPKVPCCILTVRDAAQRSLVADKDFRNWVRSTLLDESLPARLRLLSLQNFTPDGRFMTLSIAFLGSDAARAAFDIGRREQNAQVRRMAWNALLNAAPDETFLPVLLGDLASHPDEWVRTAAAQVLVKSVRNPEVHAAFERALDDPSGEVRQVAARAIAASGK
jgi:hypothetical protein